MQLEQGRQAPRAAATLDGFASVPAANETALAQAVSQHPRRSRRLLRVMPCLKIESDLRS